VVFIVLSFQLLIGSFVRSFYFLDVVGFPTLVDSGYGRAVKPDDDETPLAGHSGKPDTK